MSAATLKIRRIYGDSTPVSELETSLCQAFAELEQSADFKAEIAPLQISAAQEITVDEAQGTKAIIVKVPCPQHKAYKRIHARLIRELEKKFGGKHIVIVANRRILSGTPRTGLFKQKTPYSRTITCVHAAILDDLLFPSELIGKRERHHLSGDKTIKVQLEKKDANDLAHKLSTFTAVYKFLTSKNVVFEFPETA